MADEKDLELDKSGKKKKMIIIIVIVAIVIIAGGAAAFFFMSGDEKSAQAELNSETGTEQSSTDGGKTKAVKPTMGNALYVPMPRPFRFNVPGAARDRLVEIRVQLLVRGGDNEEAAKKHIPLVESTLLAVFTQSNADDLATSAGKTSLKQKALAEAQKVMMEVEDEKVIEQVLFTGFVMQ